MIRDTRNYLRRKLGRNDEIFATPTIFFPSGTFIHLDSGKLDLGIVRDSVVKATYDFQLFGETMVHVSASAAQATATFNKMSEFFRSNPEWGQGPYGDKE